MCDSCFERTTTIEVDPLLFAAALYTCTDAIVARLLFAGRLCNAPMRSMFLRRWVRGHCKDEHSSKTASATIDNPKSLMRLAVSCAGRGKIETATWFHSSELNPSPTDTSEALSLQPPLMFFTRALNDNDLPSQLERKSASDEQGDKN